MDGILSLRPSYSSSGEENQINPNRVLEPVLGGAGAFGILKLIDKLEKKRGIEDNNLPNPIDEEQPPQKEPPKGPNIVEDILNEVAKKEIEKNIKDKQPVKEDQQKELKEYIAEDNKFWDENREKANEKYPNLKVENLPKLVEADKHFGAAAMSFENFKESQLIYLSPQEYLDLTKRFGRTDGTLTEGSKLRIENLEKIISEGGELANIPYLYVKKSGDYYKVDGQEGRHRAQAFKNLGYDKIPVAIQGTGKDKVAGIENKVYTATPKSYLYKEDWAKDYIGFIPKGIESDSELVLTKPSDFYDVRTKERLFPDKVKEETQKEISEEVKPKSYTTQNYLDDKLMDELLVMRGGIKGFEEKMSGPMAPMPSSTKYKMEIELQKKLFDKYGFGNYPEGETPDTVTPERKEELLNRYDRRIGAINYISSVAYDVIGEPDSNALLVVDEDGLPIAAAKIDIPGKGALSGSDISSRDAVVITEMGSVFREANDQLFNDIIQKAKDENRRFIVAEDLTSEKAYQAVKNRGFKDPTTKDTKKFKGQKIRRPSGKIAYQKNLVLDLDPPKKTIKPSNIYKSLDAGGSKDI